MKNVPTMTVKNYDQFQSYQERGIANPEWIKLYRSLLTDYDFQMLTEKQRFHLIMIWLLAVDVGNKLPYDRAWIKKNIGATSAVDLDSLIRAGWLQLDGEFQLSKGKKRRDTTENREKRLLGGVEKVWDSYISAWTIHYEDKNGKVGVEPSLTPTRRTLISKALHAHGTDKVLDAIIGLFMSEFHCGKNDDGKEWLGIEYALKMTTKRDSVEHFAMAVRETANLAHATLRGEIH